MIFEWEKKNLEKVAKDKKIEFKIEPGQTDYDSKSNTRIITTYAFKAKACPFLKDKRCSIHPNRPLYCRAYPLLAKISKDKIKLNLLDCENAEVPKPKEYYNDYGDIFLYALELEIFRNHYLDLIKSLKDNNIINTRKEKQSDNPKESTLFEFLIKNKFLLQKDVDKIIHDITNLSNAKEMINLV